MKHFTLFIELHTPLFSENRLAFHELPGKANNNTEKLDQPMEQPESEIILDKSSPEALQASVQQAAQAATEAAKTLENKQTQALDATNEEINTLQVEVPLAATTQPSQPVAAETRKTPSLHEFKNKLQVTASFNEAMTIYSSLNRDNFGERLSLQYKAERLEKSIDAQASAIAQRDFDDALTSDQSRVDVDQLFHQQENTTQAVKQSLIKDHNSMNEYDTFRTTLETRREAVNHIHIHPGVDIITLDQSAIDTFAIDSNEYISFEQWKNENNKSTLQIGDNTSFNNELPTNTLLPFVLKNPKETMQRIRTQMREYKQGGNVLVKNETLLIEDQLHDDVPQTVEDILESATLNESGEWVFKNPKAAEFLAEYTKEIPGDDYLDAQEASWTVNEQERYRQFTDSASIETRKKVAEFKALTDAAGLDWSEVEPYVVRATQPENKDDKDSFNKANTAQKELYRLLYANSTEHSIPLANQARADVETFLQAYQEYNSSYNVSTADIARWQAAKFNNSAEFAVLDQKIQSSEAKKVELDALRLNLHTKYPHLRSQIGIPPMQGIGMSAPETPVNAEFLRNSATFYLDEQISKPSHQAQRTVKQVLMAVTLSRDSEKYWDSSFNKAKNAPTTRGRVQAAIEDQISSGKPLKLSNAAMSDVRLWINRRATNSIRVHRKRITDVNKYGTTAIDPKRTQAVDIQRILIPKRAEVLLHKIKNIAALENNSTLDVTQAQRLEAIELLRINAAEVLAHVQDIHGSLLPKDLQARFDEMNHNITRLTKLNEEVAFTEVDGTLFKALVSDTEVILEEILTQERVHTDDRSTLHTSFDTLATMEDGFMTLEQAEEYALSLPDHFENRLALLGIIQKAKNVDPDNQPFNSFTTGRAFIVTGENKNGVPITFNRRGEMGIHVDNSDGLLNETFEQHIILDSFTDMHSEVLAQSKFPITVKDTSIPPYIAQALRAYSGPKAHLTLPNITSISPAALKYLGRVHAPIDLTITHTDLLSDDVVDDLFAGVLNHTGNTVVLKVPANTELTAKRKGKYNALWSAGVTVEYQ